MNTNEKIATWLGMKKLTKNAYERKIDGGYKYYFLDFLHDCNQQKWIEDKLEKEEYWIEYLYNTDAKIWLVFIHKNENMYRTDYHLIQIRTMNKERNLAFISAIEQLIDKENENHN